MASFENCFPFVLANEAGAPPKYDVVPDPTAIDPGAQACAGVNSAAFPAWFAAISGLPISMRDTQVRFFYQKTYWNQWIAQLADPIAMRVMDAEVNEGQGTGVKLLQEASNAYDAPTVPQIVDGVWGPVTISRANACDQSDLLRNFQAARIARYRAIAASNPSEAANLPAWIARAEK